MQKVHSLTWTRTDQTGPLSTQLAAILGERHLLTGAAMAPYLHEERGLFTGRALAVARPGSVAEVAALMRAASEAGAPVVPRGGGTGLVGGASPDESGHAIVLSLDRLRALREIDTEGNTMTVEAGMTLQEAQAHADRNGRYFPLSLGSEGSCTIGGNIASNAGGISVLAFGNMRDLVVGLEVVLADGRVWNGLRKLRKDNTGYDLAQLFSGSEGTLGIITAAVLKVFPKLHATETAFLGLKTPAAALRVLQRFRDKAGPTLVACEIMSRFSLDIVLTHGQGARDPMETPHPWYMLVELATPRQEPLRGTLETVLEAAMNGEEIDDAVIVETIDQRLRLWKLRHLMSELQKFEGGSIKHDVSVPVAAVPRFIEEAIIAAGAVVPGCRPAPFGHLGDGNIHFNVSQPVDMDKAEFLSRWNEMNRAVHDVVGRHGGSIAAEHGIGRLKRDLLPRVKSDVEMDLMHLIKQAFDPRGILNPGCLLEPGEP